ncbi:S8 family serine peptidase [Luteolibacter arcticus]|uniref:S8 family serine peptidase n=1 Tax=Luteolibacter arcticus TaxID=1581411 RepID=A0ABT3GHK3_9BACT|nr:S8 family serine peptidase [Luteolibacter arcticus]MCW1922818.1 S8 family serine peptidase [Luteolibacter arcticus]
MTETALRLSRGIFRILLPILAITQVSAEPFEETRAPAEREIPIEPNGAVADAGWALGRLNKGGCMANASFVYPETTTPVRLYLIDTGVSDAGTWFAQNKNLKSFRSELVRGGNDPQFSTVVAHGTQMLSLIAGPETGAALGTPIHVVNYNIYPGTSPTTTSGRLADAIDRAIGDHAANPALRSVICIAHGSSYPGAQTGILEGAIQEAVDAGITVVVSAGNEGGNASSYIPGAYGTRSGIVCVGASDLNNGILPSSNTGPAVDLFAPGQDVRTLKLSNPQPGSYDFASGTSPASALTAAAALIQLSINPTLTPAQVEEALTTKAAPSVILSQTAPAELLVQVLPDPETDSDLDGVNDILENFFGSNSANAAIKPVPMAIARVSGQARLSFNVASDLFNPATPYVLADGSTWKVWMSDNLTDWQDATTTGALSPGTAANGVIPMTFSVPNAASKVFLRIDVTLPPSAP